MLVKICGTTTPADARLAAESGADFVGVIVEHPPSPRSVTLAKAAEIAAASPIPIIALTVNLSLPRLLEIHETLHPHALQLHGDESPQLVSELRERGLKVWAVTAGNRNAVLQRAAQLTAAGAEAVLVDARETSPDGVIYGGTGKKADWNVAKELAQNGTRVILAGGLTPKNVAAAIELVAPWMVDAVSGVEAGKGVKDAAKVKDFVAAAKAERGNVARQP